MSMTTALSGLIAAQHDISTTAHNIANVGTNAFRKSRAEFADDYYTTPLDSFRTVVGSGTHMSRVAVQFGQGNFVSTGQTLDLAIQGAGLFTVASELEVNGDPAEIQYTRDGSFRLDANGRISNSTGRPMLAWPTARDGTVLQTTNAALSTVDIPLTKGSIIPTDEVYLNMNLPVSEDMIGSQDAVPPTNAFDPADATSFAYSTPIPVTDAEGNAVEARAYMIRTASPDATSAETEYEARLVVDGVEIPVQDPVGNPTTFRFDAAGILSSDASNLVFEDTLQTYTLDLTGSRMRDEPFTVQSVDHNGAMPQGLSNLEVDPMGIIWANYGTDDRVALGRVALTYFANPQGLRQTGGASFRAAAESGEPDYQVPGENGLGQLQSGMLERSNVDLTEELVHLISAQRNYQANAKAMETSSSLMQTIINIRT